jgi:eukaryotic-like serine/threonine-protein kinase
MPLSSGTRLGSYEILAALGAGGMGEVYRARDTKLNRDVAIKVLPELFANESERLARFRREAQMLAALNHPNIAHIHGFEDSGDIHALVMELVDGLTLAERIEQGPIPLAEALRIAQQIATALEAAHGQGIIHRDLKPANVKVRDDGTVKVLDFGLAKLASPELSPPSTGGVAHPPTVTSPAVTLAGVILGTAAYMSPEQTKGRAADKRSDIWAFGAVLYEMLTARRAFEGEDVSDTLANVLKSEPDWSALPADVPWRVRMLVQRCLAKDRQQRIADMSVALFVMTDEAASPSPLSSSSESIHVPQRRPRWRRVAVALIAALLLGTAVGTMVWLTMRQRAAPVTRFALVQAGATALSPDPQSRDLTITPDGTHIVYKGAAGTSDTRLYVRPLDQLEPRPLTGPGAYRAPFASPDGQWIGFVESGPITLKKVAITGGPALLLCELDGASRGATWGDDDTIVFATSVTATGLQRVPAAGGKPVVLTTPDRARGENDHLWPHFLPGGDAILFTITAVNGGIDASQVAVLDLRSGNATPKILLRGGSQAQYVSSGHLVYATGGALRAVAFDLKRRELIGTPIPMISDVVVLPTGTAEFDVARDGTLVYVTGGAGPAPPRMLVWVDRNGQETAIEKSPARPFVSPRLSPDGTRVAVGITDQNQDIWVFDLAAAALTRVTIDPGIDEAPVWMADRRRVAFSSQTGGGSGGLFQQLADGSGTAERLRGGANVARPSAISPDGKRLLFTEAVGTTGADVLMISLDGDHQVQPLVQTPFIDRNGEISPDGRWLAYDSNDSGQYQIYVRPFPDVNQRRWQVSTEGGTQPLWSRNGQELYFRAADGAVMSMRVTPGTTWTASTAVKVIDGRYYRGTSSLRQYDVSPDGKRFLMIKSLDDATQPPTPTSIVVVRNWHEELKRLVPLAPR